MNYLDRHRRTVAELFAALGENPPQDDGDLVKYMERRWLRGEHGPGEGKPNYGPEIKERAWPLLRRLGLVDRVAPPRGEYDEVLVMGAASIGLHRRLELVRISGVQAPRLTILAGQRPHGGYARDGALDELLAADGRFAAVEGWQPPGILSFQASLLPQGLNALLAARILLPSETDLARLLLSKQWPGAILSEVEVDRDVPDVTNELGPRTFITETYRMDGPIPVVQLWNGHAVERRDRDGNPLPARPTSRSTVQEWIAARAPLPARVLAVVNQPHLSRVRQDIREELDHLQPTQTVDLDVAGCEALIDSADLNLLLGEIPASINAAGEL